MKRTLLILLTILTLLTVAACAKKPAKDPNAVLTDSNVPLEVGAEILDDATVTEANAAETP